MKANNIGYLEWASLREKPVLGGLRATQAHTSMRIHAF